MGRKRKPTAVLEMSGAFKKNPDRRRNEPESTGPLGSPPESFSKPEVEAWRVLVERAPTGVLRKRPGIPSCRYRLAR